MDTLRNLFNLRAARIREQRVERMNAVHAPRWIWNGYDWTAWCCGTVRSGHNHDKHVNPDVRPEPIDATLLLSLPVPRKGDIGLTVGMETV